MFLEIDLNQQRLGYVSEWGLGRSGEEGLVGRSIVKGRSERKPMSVYWLSHLTLASVHVDRSRPGILGGDVRKEED